MIQRVITAGKKVECPTGIHAMDPQNALERAEQGMQFIAVGSDLRMMTQKAQETITKLHPNQGKKIGSLLMSLSRPEQAVLSAVPAGFVKWLRFFKAQPLTPTLSAEYRGGGAMRECMKTTSLALLFSSSVATSLPKKRLTPTLPKLSKTWYKRSLPALGVIVIKEGKVCDRGGIGVRKAGEKTAVTMADHFHIGSCTKAMTATLAGIYMTRATCVGTQPSPKHPDLKGKMHQDYEAVTVEQLLQNRGGLPTSPPAKAWERAWQERGVWSSNAPNSLPPRSPKNLRRHLGKRWSIPIKAMPSWERCSKGSNANLGNKSLPRSCSSRCR